MSTRQNGRRAIRFILPLLAFILAIGIVFAFKANPAKPVQTEKKAANVTLAFLYQAPSSSYSSSDVNNPSNWLKVDPSALCNTNTNDVACSFSISVPSADASSYYNSSTMQGTSRLLISSIGTANAYVSDIKDNSTPSHPSVASGIDNQPQP